jgi:hypothetical protein
MRNSIGSGFCSAYDPIEDLYILIAKLSISGTEEVSTESSKGSPYFARGPLLTYDEIESERELELEIEFEQITANQVPLILNRRGASGTFLHPVGQQIALDDEEVAVAGLTADQPCQVTELLGVAPGQRQFIQVPLTEPAPDPLDPDVPVVVDPGEFQVDAGELIFHEDDIGPGKVAGLRYLKETTSVVYGGPNAILGFDSLEIYVEQTHTKIAPMAFYFPKVKLTSGAQFAIQAGGDPVTLTCKALIDTEKGFNDYFACWEI